MDKREKEQFNFKLNEWRESPYKFVTEVLGAKPLSYRNKDPRAKVITTQQKELLDLLGKFALARRKKLRGITMSDIEVELARKLGFSLKSGKGSGKTCTLSWIIIWFLICFPAIEMREGKATVVKTRVVCSAVNQKQLRDIILAEIRTWLTNAKGHSNWGMAVCDSIKVEAERLYVPSKYVADNDKETWCVIFRTAAVASGGTAEGMQGQHAQNMLVITDEASGIDNSVFEALTTTCMEDFNFMIMTYNPMRVSGFAYDSQKGQRDLWNCVHWNCEECENIGEDVIEQRRKQYGRDSDRYRINVLGLEPSGNSLSVIPLDWILECVDRDLGVTDDDACFMGVDVARFGDDKTCLYVRHGSEGKAILEYDNFDTMEVTGLVNATIVEQEELGRPLSGIGVDTIGIGAGVYDRLREQGRNVTAVVSSRKASNEAEFPLVRDELWWKVRELFEKRMISIPNNEDLIYELSNVNYSYLSNGKIKIESKAEMKSRKVPSPNKADALIYSYYFSDMQYRKSSMKGDMWGSTKRKVRDWMAA